MIALVSSLALGSNPPIGKYSPATNVLDHANIDLDQKALEAAFGSSPYDFAAVKAAWEGSAANSKVTATCTLQSGSISAVLAYANSSYGDKIVYKGIDLQTYTVNAISDFASGATTVTFKPMVVQNAPDARVDTSQALVTAAGANIGTCGTVTYAGGRTLAGFSTGAKKKMYVAGSSCPTPKPELKYPQGCPYTSYKPYFDYYCASATSACNANGDYVNQWILSATDTPLSATAMDNYNINFATGAANQENFRKDFVKKVSKFAGAWMYAIREFEDAIDDCSLQDLTSNQWSDGSVHAWDEGIAFYVGSAVRSNMYYHAVTGEETAPPNDHYLAYTLGNKRCVNFKTCGRSGDRVAGEAYINFELWKLFGDGRDQILAGNCAGAVPVKNQIVSLMTVPLVQGSLRYAYYCRNGITCSSKALGELAAFVASVLPQVHACSPSAAATIASAADPSAYTCTDATSCSGAANDFAKTKAAFEQCYPSMGITCALVGGLYDKNALQYYPDGLGPCSDASNAVKEDSSLSTGAIAGIAVGAGVAAIVCILLMFVITKEKAGTPLFSPLQPQTGTKSSAAA